MGLFESKEEKQQKREEKINQLLSKYELNNISKEYINAIQNINAELSGTGLIEFGSFLSYSDKDTQRLHSYYLNALIQQNWIIIRQLNEISAKLSSNENKSNLSSIIECKVCGKRIPYNENETCENCHKIIIERLKSKGM